MLIILTFFSLNLDNLACYPDFSENNDESNKFTVTLPLNQTELNFCGIDEDYYEILLDGNSVETMKNLSIVINSNGRADDITATLVGYSSLIRLRNNLNHLQLALPGISNHYQ